MAINNYHSRNIWDITFLKGISKLEMDVSKITDHFTHI